MTNAFDRDCSRDGSSAALKTARRSSVTSLILLALVACASSGSFEAAPAVAQSASGPARHPFPEPTGSHPLGVFEAHWVDQQRYDPLTTDPNDRRRVPIRVTYPAERGGRRAPYVFNLGEFEGVDAFQLMTHVELSASLDAPVAEGRFPVLVYHHGGGWPRFIGTALVEELVSWGYVVVAVGHDGFNGTTRRADETSTVADAFPFPEETGDLLADALASWAHLEKHHFPQWVADATFVLDRLESLESEGWVLSGKLDFDRIGMFGWSFGGATSIELLTRDDRVRAAIDLDGQLFGQAAKVGASAPFMIVKAAEVTGLPTSEDPEEAARLEAIGEQLMDMVAQNDRSLIASSTGPWQTAEIAGANHGTFSDFLHLFPETAGSIEPDRGHEIVAALVRGFFGRYLLGQEIDLGEIAGQYEEVSWNAGIGENPGGGEP